MTNRIYLTGQKQLGAAVYALIASIDGLDVCGVSAPERSEKPDALWSLATVSGPTPTPAGERLDADRIPDDTDLILCAYSHEYVTQAARQKVSYGAVGYHPSMLPRYRGKSAVEAQIKAGEIESGGSLYILDDGWDTGVVIAQEAVPVSPGDTVSSLWREKLQPLGLKLIEAFLRDLVQYGPVWHSGYVRAYFVNPPNDLDYLIEPFTGN